MITIGAIGTSFIMDSILAAIADTEGIECKAIYSRSREKGQALAGKFDIEKVYTELDDMLADDEINWIYVASPNSLHYPQTKQALLAGKHVLCEKPFTSTAEEAAELIRLARDKHLFLVEAILPLFHPNYRRIQEFLPRIGNLKLVLGTFCQYSSRYEALLAGNTPNVFNPAFSGGALMDLNLYNIYFVVGLFGKPDSLQYYPTIYENGIDTNGILMMQYPDFLCQCTGAKDTFCDNGVRILGDKGYIRVTPTASICQTVEIVLRGEEPLSFTLTETPYHDEMQGLVEMVEHQDYAECSRRQDIALSVMEVLSQARKSGGLCF
jgi:predicted dehydrogenase